MPVLVLGDENHVLLSGLGDRGTWRGGESNCQIFLDFFAVLCVKLCGSLR